MKILKYIDSVIARVEYWLIVYSLSIMVILTFCNVVLRALYTHAHIQWANTILGQMDWTELLVRLLILWVTFLGASLLTGDNRHIKIDIMSPLLSKKWLPVREVLLSLVCVIICALMLKASIGYIMIEMEYGGELFLGLPVWTGQIILPIGFAVILFRFLLTMLTKTIESIQRIKT
ncbi:TRAP transporter small permease [Thermodesulfobacteriota bacterium]